MTPVPDYERLTKLAALGGFVLIMLLCCPTLCLNLMAEEGPGATKTSVVLLHGLGRSHRSMRAMEHALTRRGYEVINLPYPSTRYPIQDLARAVGEAVEQRCMKPNQVVHFVTHSLGGIILRAYLSGYPPLNIGRIVMLAPPNRGSELADILCGNPWLACLDVPAIAQLGTCRTCIPSGLGPVYGQVGVITGDKSLNPFFSYLIPGADDGTVSVKSASVEGMKAFLVVHHSHTFIVNSPEVISQVVNFLEQGTFKEQP